MLHRLEVWKIWQLRYLPYMSNRCVSSKITSWNSCYITFVMGHFIIFQQLTICFHSIILILTRKQGYVHARRRSDLVLKIFHVISVSIFFRKVTCINTVTAYTHNQSDIFFIADWDTIQNIFTVLYLMIPIIRLGAYENERKR